MGYMLHMESKMGKIPTAIELSKRGKNALVTILVRCSYTNKVMEWILRWCNIPMEDFHMVFDVLGSCRKWRKLLLGICYGTLWSIWKAMYYRIFNNNGIPPVKVIEITKSVTFLLVKNRSNKKELIWAKWF
uniref:Uncharacterized protein n=1 Tax=Lactuca sativa TaxID=4236 RepID=A0A9R1X9L0_LACSA|nr:hypothetical protein LSAT_V11C500290320 [Lactuca sativa]